MTVNDLAKKLSELIAKGKGEYNISLEGGEYDNVQDVVIVEKFKEVDIA